MAYEQKEGGGTLFRNERKQGAQPDWRGDCKINGKKMKIAGWIKKGAKGDFISLKIEEDNYQKSPYQEQNNLNDPHPVQTGGFGKSGPVDDLEDTIPF